MVHTNRTPMEWHHSTNAMDDTLRLKRDMGRRLAEDVLISIFERRSVQAEWTPYKFPIVGGSLSAY